MQGRRRTSRTHPARPRSEPRAQAQRRHRTIVIKGKGSGPPLSFRLEAGDSLELLCREPAASVGAVVTDPPYGISWTDSKGRGVLNDDGPFVWWMRSAHNALRRGGPIVCFTRWDVAEPFRLALGWAGFTVRSMIVWDKLWGGQGDTRRTLAPSHEIAWLATKGNWRLPGKRTRDVISVPRVRDGRTHPAEKPVAMLREIVRTVTRPGDVVLDPFMGTGSTAEACLAEGRSFVGIEQVRDYVDIAERRLLARRQELAAA